MDRYLRLKNTDTDIFSRIRITYFVKSLSHLTKIHPI